MSCCEEKKADAKKVFGLYVHIPFCVKKCNYCDFLSAPADEATQKRYVNALCQEIRSYQDSTRRYELATVYFGGGTPSVLKVSLMEQLLESIQKSFTLNLQTAEITMEVNPGTTTPNNLLEYRRLGINRLSIGVQSAKQAELALLGRIHSFKDAENTVQWARKAKFQNISLDVISALPRQSLDNYKETLEAVLLLEPEHISSYSLIIEENTPFYEWYAKGKTKEKDLPEEETDRAMYLYTKERLAKAGYERYEISNYARPGFESRHNSSYWTGTEYLGVGLGASSLFANTRYHNEVDLLTYMEAVENGQDVRREIEALTKTDQMEEFMILGLRRMCGISRTEFQNRFGIPCETMYGTALQKLKKQGLITITEDCVALTELGIDVSNQVFVEFVPEEFA